MVGITKKEVLEAALRGEGCLGKCADDEPVFVLVARDNEAADLVDTWALRNNTKMPMVGSEHLYHKINEAKQIADAMRVWPHKRDAD